MLTGCASIMNQPSPFPQANENKDVIVLTNLLQKQFMHHFEHKIEVSSTTLKQVLEQDSLKRIDHNFDSITVKNCRKGYEIEFWFSSKRDLNFELNEEELKLTANHLWQISEQQDNQSDGVIKLSYPERFYRPFQIKRYIQRTK